MPPHPGLPKRQRTGALHDASQDLVLAGERSSVLDCGGPPPLLTSRKEKENRSPSPYPQNQNLQQPFPLLYSSLDPFAGSQPSTFNFQLIPSSSKRGVFPDATPPREPRQRIREQQPKRLHQQTEPDVRTGDFAHVNGDGHVKHGRKRREKERVADHGRQKVEREQMAAGEIFEREQDENERGNFQQPERQHGHGVGNKELQQRRQHERNHKGGQRRPAGRPNHIIPETEYKNRQRHTRHGDERDAPGKKQAQPVPQIINRLEQELADVAFADVGGDLPVVLVHRRQHVHDADEQVVKNHLRLGVTAERAPLPFPGVDGAPERQHGEQRDETEQ